MGGFGVYIHFPYCSQRCPYCDFAVAVRKTIRHERYLDAVTAELLAKAPLYAGRRARSVYFGGGTPSLWRPECVAAALSAVRQAFPPPGGTELEVTLECDPASLSAEAMAGFFTAGINRLSIGAQSFARRHLVVLGRRHQPEQTAALVQAARQVGFRNLSLDLMIGLVGQRPSELEADLQALLSQTPEHVSLYQLTVEPRTPLGASVRRGMVAAPDPHAQAAAYERVREVLAAAGYSHYEVSNFARRDGGVELRSQHNSLYWTGGEYLGLGVGAHSFRRFRGAGADGPYGERFANQRGVDGYLALWAKGSGVPPAFALGEDAPGLSLYERLHADALAREAVWLGLRRLEGISCAGFAAEYGVDLQTEYGDAVAKMAARGWLEVAGDTLRLTPEGVLFADEVGAAFL